MLPPPPIKASSTPYNCSINPHPPHCHPAGSSAPLPSHWLIRPVVSSSYSPVIFPHSPVRLYLPPRPHTRRNKHTTTTHTTDMHNMMPHSTPLQVVLRCIQQESLHAAQLRSHVAAAQRAAHSAAHSRLVLQRHRSAPPAAAAAAKDERVQLHCRVAARMAAATPSAVLCCCAPVYCAAAAAAAAHLPAAAAAAVRRLLSDQQVLHVAAQACLCACAAASASTRSAACGRPAAPDWPPAGLQERPQRRHPQQPQMWLCCCENCRRQSAVRPLALSSAMVDHLQA